METDRDTSGAPDRPDRPGVLGTLLDRSFEVSATLTVVRLLYTLALACVTAVNVLLFALGWNRTTGGFWPALGWVIVAGVPPLWLAELIVVRVVVEYLIVQHKISADLTVIRHALTEHSGPT
jgi:hypothetical protein